VSHHFDIAADRSGGRINPCDLYAFSGAPGTTAARLAGLPDPDGHAAPVTAAFLPDVLTYRPGRPAGLCPGDGNGRTLGDNAFDVAIALLAGSALGNASTTPSHPRVPLFPNPAG